MFRISSRLRSSSWRIATPTSSSRSCALRQAASRIPRASRQALRSYGAASRSTTPARSRADCARCRASSAISPTPSTRTIARRRLVFSRRRHRPAALCPPLGFPRPTSSSRFAFPCPIPKGVVAEVTTMHDSAGCNIQSIEIDRITEDRAVLSLVLTDEGDVGKLSAQLIGAGFSVIVQSALSEGGVISMSISDRWCPPCATTPQRLLIL